mgnify:CR=1 FL=1
MPDMMYRAILVRIGIMRFPQTVMDVLNGTNPYNTDAYDEIFQTAPQQSYNLSVQGGNGKNKICG